MAEKHEAGDAGSFEFQDLWTALIDDPNLEEAASQPVNVHTDFGKSRVLIYNMCPGITAGILKQMIAVLTKNSDIKVLKLRISSNGFSESIVVLPKGDADVLVERKNLVSNDFFYRVFRLPCPASCSICMRLGHTAFECQSIAYFQPRCTKCTQVGHSITTCPNAAFCPNCICAGHEFNSFSCPFSQNQADKMIEMLMAQELKSYARKTK